MPQALSQLLARTELWVIGLGIAAFLALYWALRGAPIGQEAEDEGAEAPRAGYRDRVIAAMVFGLLLIIAGAYVALARSVPWSIPVFATGFGIVLVLVARNEQYRHSSPLLKRTLQFSNAALTAALVAGILIVLNVLAFRYGGRPLDLTRERAFSLSALTEKQLTALDRPVRFTMFFGDSPRSALQSDRVHQLLEEYKSANPRRIRVESINPYREHEKYEAVVKRIPNVAVMQGGAVLIEYGDGEKPAHSVVRYAELFDIGRAGAGDLESTFRGEDAITSALIALREGKRPKIVFTTGHGEPSIDNPDPRLPGLGAWKARLSAMGADVVQVNLIESEVPEDASLVVVAGPRSPFRPDAVSRLRTHLDRGGPGLFLIGNQDASGLDDVLKSYNVEFGRGTVVEPRLSLRSRAQVIYVGPGAGVTHPIVDSLAGRFVLMPSSAPLVALGSAGTGPGNRSLLATPLLRTSPESWAETELSKGEVKFTKGVDQRGPVTVGVAVSERPKPGSQDEPRPRLVVLASPMMAENSFLEAESTNQDMLMNSIAWLRGRADLQGILPTKHVAMTLAAQPVLRFRLVMVPTVMAVVMIMGLGITTYLARRE